MWTFEFHPTVARWFKDRFGSPTQPQERGWPAIQSGQHTLIAAPTGSGKTLAAFLAALDELFREGLNGTLRDETRVVYVSPLKALSNDIHKNLEEPLAGIGAALRASEGRAIEVRAAVRTGDTPAAERQAMAKKPPHILVTTPESFYLLLTSESGRKMLATARTLIVDEIHALVSNRRGSHLALSMERLRTLVRGPLQRIGLSATQKPIEEVALFLVGNRRGGGDVLDPTLEGVSCFENETVQTVRPHPDPTAIEPGELRQGGNADFSPLPAALGGCEGSGLKSALLNSTAVHATPLPQGRETKRPHQNEPAQVESRDLGNAPQPGCTIIDSGHSRKMDLAIELPGSPLGAVMSNEVWAEVYNQVADLIEQHRTTLVFVNTRRLAERATHHLTERLGEDKVMSHHGSLSAKLRLEAENRLKRGELRALVATASLELGIDIGSVDLVCQLGPTRSIATLLQRVGRAQHQRGGLPKGRLFPLSRDELVECAATLRCIRNGELDCLQIPEKPLDVLAQQIVACAACEPWEEQKLFELMRSAYPYRTLSRDEFDQVLQMLAEGYSTRRGRRSALVHYDAVNHRVRGRRGARLIALTSGGAIPDTADYRVLLEPGETFLGTVNEDFAVESMAGDVFQLGNASWRILGINSGAVRVEDAHGQPPGIPFWLGEAPGRTRELSVAVSELRKEIEQRIKETVKGNRADEGQSKDAFTPRLEEENETGGNVRPHPGPLPQEREKHSEAAGTVALGGAEPPQGGPVAKTARARSNAVQAVANWLVDETGLGETGASQLADYFCAAHQALGVIPSQDRIVIERFFDESGGMQLVIHAPFGIRLNRAWGLALRKRFCRSFNFELQAAAIDDAIVLSLGTQHSFPLEEVFHYLHSQTVRDVLVQALLDAPMFPVRWRWNATRALALPRQRGGRKVPAPLQRMEAENLIAAVFPDQLACLENMAGDREIPDHPLVRQTIEDCLTEAMDVEGLIELLRRIESGEVECLARDVPEPSPLAQEILNARPYAFLDNAPLEERRTQAVYTRRAGDVSADRELGILDVAAIERVREEAWPRAVNEDELHEALWLLGVMTEEEVRRCVRSQDVRGGPSQVVRALQPFDERPSLPAIFPAQSGGEGGRSPGEGSAVHGPDACESRKQAFQEPTADEPTPDLSQEGNWPTGATPLLGGVGGGSKDAIPGQKTVEPILEMLMAEKRAGRFRLPRTRAAEEADDVSKNSAADSAQRPREFLVPAERLAMARAVYPDGEIDPPIVPPESAFNRQWERSEAICELVRGRMEVIGPVTSGTLAEYFRLPPTEIGAALLALEAEGFVLRGQFHPGIVELEWCDRRLLARIHRMTIHRLRAEIEPVSAADFQRFLLAWQRVDAAHRAEGPEGVEAVLELLDGYELPAAAWEPDVLAVRVKNYTPEWLDRLCFTGRIGWGRLTPLQNQKARAFTPLRSSPVSVFFRENLAQWMELSISPALSEVLPDTEQVLRTLSQEGALFFHQIVRRTGLLPSRVEQALGELAASGWVTADSFEGLRALLIPSEKRAPFADVERMRRHRTVTSIEFAGRWSLLRTPEGQASGLPRSDMHTDESDASTLSRKPPKAGGTPALPSRPARDQAIETYARVLLRRYGVVFRRLLERESVKASWFELGRIYRRLEARGEIRGGFFVNGVSGEQFALPEAVGLLRSLRRMKAGSELIALSAADPLNLVGILTPGRRVTAIASNRVLLRDGLPIAALEAGQIVKLEKVATVEDDRQIELALKVGKLPAALRPYYA